MFSNRKKMLEVLFVVAMILGYGNCQYIIQDVWGEPPNSVAGWTTNSCTSPTYTSNCAGQTIIGGYDVFGTGAWAYKTYSGLPGHNSVTLKWDAYYLDSWEGNEVGGSDPPWYDSYILKVDGTVQYWNIYLMGANSNTNYCGESWPDWITTVTLSSIPHNSSTIQLYFTTGLNQGCTDEEFGFKNIQITVNVICTPACATCYGNANTQCYSCNSGWYLSGNTCGTTCPTGQWGNPSGNVCQNCDLSCYNCNGASSSNCIQCSGTYLNLPPQGSCSPSCPLGYYPNTGSLQCSQCYQGSGSLYYNCPTCSGGNYNQCTSCNSGSFLYPNTGGACFNPCPNGFWGDTSTNTCKPCYSSSKGPYYSCATCPNGGTNNSCSSCNSGYFLYPNTGGQCLNLCPAGYWGNTTTNTCQLCSSDTVNISSCPTKVQSNIVSALQISAKSSSTVLVAASAALQNSNSASCTITVNLFLYLAAIEAIANMQYLNLNHSQIALDAYSRLSASIIPNWVSNYNTINNSMLVFNYGIFEKNQISPLYLDNYGDSLTETLIYAGVYLILVPITFIKTSEKLLSSRLGKAYAIALGLFFCSVFGQIQSQILFSVLQILKTDLLIDAYSRSSYFIAWITMYAIMWLQLFCFCKLKAIFSLKQRQKKMIDINSKDTHNQIKLTANTINFRWTEKQYDMIFSSYKDDNKLRFFFTYWMILFDTIYITLILCLQYVPGLQCLSIVLFTIYFIVFSAILRPMKEKSEAFLFFFNYASVLLVAILNLALAVREISNSQPKNNDDIGRTIYIIITINSCMNILFAICGILSRIYSLYRKWKDRRQNSNAESSSKDLTIGKNRSSQRASRSIDTSNTALNFIEEHKEETPEPQGKLHTKELKIIKKKHEHSIRRNEKKFHIPGLE